MDQERINRLAAEFIKSEYGGYLMEVLKAMHYGLHQEAESAETLERRGLQATKAAGVRDVIDLITGQAQMFQNELEQSTPKK